MSHKNGKKTNQTILKPYYFKNMCKKNYLFDKLQLFIKTLNQYFVFQTSLFKLNTAHHICFSSNYKVIIYGGSVSTEDLS